MGGHQNAMAESDGGMLITMHSRLVDCAISSMDSIRMLTYTTTVGEKRMLVPVLECGELYSYKVSSFRWFDKTWQIRVTKKVRLGTPLERNSLITILANRAAKHYIIHLLLQPNNMYWVLICTTHPLLLHDHSNHTSNLQLL